MAPPGTEGAGEEQTAATRPNPVALEVLVSVTGARGSEDKAARDLFSEETTTVLVFKEGAVIRLHAAVSIGQLLFLRNKKSNQEVVCQVLKNRSFKAGSNYVELQFTEERADYWGVAFPENKEAAHELKAPEQVQAEQTTAEEPGKAVSPRSAEDVQRLKREVDALRDQLAAPEKKNLEESGEKAKALAEATAAREAAARETAAREAARAIEAIATNEAIAARAKVELAPVNDQSPEQAEVKEERPALLMPAANDRGQVARAVVGMALPVWKQEKSPEAQLLKEEEGKTEAQANEKGKVVKEPEDRQESGEELLPKPALDFTQGSNSGKRARQGEAETVALPNTAGMDKRRVMAMSAMLMLVLLGGAWYGKWWQYLPIGNHAAASAPLNRPVPARTAAAGNVKTVATEGTSAAVVNGTGGKVSVDAGKSASVPLTAQAVPASQPADADTAEETPAEKKPSWRESLLGKKSEEKVEEAPIAADPLASVDAAVIPAKLLKTVNPVYPPDAMRHYITGDVKAEVVVEASGHVGEVKVISGPQALREAAVEALQQYEYAPATQGGKTVQSKAETVVKFWFNP
jgi:TonB family protein